MSGQYTEQKGFCEDIGEGKLSLPVVHALQSHAYRGRLLSVLNQRKSQHGLSNNIRKLVLDDIRAAGGLTHARETVASLQGAIEEKLMSLEEETGMKNWILRLIQLRLEL